MRIILLLSLVILSLNSHAYERMTAKTAQVCTVKEINGNETCTDIAIKDLVLDFDSYKGQLWWSVSFEIQPTPPNLNIVPVNLPLAMGTGEFAGCYNHIGGSRGDDKNDQNWSWDSGLNSLDYSSSVSWHGNWGFERTAMQIARSSVLKTATISYTHYCNASYSRYTQLKYLIDAKIIQ